jgi:hypothetical protein
VDWGGCDLVEGAFSRTQRDLTPCLLKSMTIEHRHAMTGGSLAAYISSVNTNMMYIFLFPALSHTHTHTHTHSLPFTSKNQSRFFLVELSLWLTMRRLGCTFFFCQLPHSSIWNYHMATTYILIQPTPSLTHTNQNLGKTSHLALWHEAGQNQRPASQEESH